MFNQELSEARIALMRREMAKGNNWGHAHHR